RSQIFDFLPKDVTIKAGDTIVWGSEYFHTVTFDPKTPGVDFILPKPPEGQAPPQLILNPDVLRPAKPAGTYDATQYFNSADLRPFSLGAASWALTFDKPGTYEYFCAVHRDLGMKGKVIVQPR